MPLYLFSCPVCGKEAEILQSMNGTPPVCCGKTMERRITAANHSFGWRLTAASHLPGRKDELEKDV